MHFDTTAHGIIIDIIDISFDIRESLYFGVTLPENGIVFEVVIKLTPHFESTLRGFASICRFPWTIPDIDVTNKLKMDEIVKFEQYLKDGKQRLQLFNLDQVSNLSFG